MRNNIQLELQRGMKLDDLQVRAGSFVVNHDYLSNVIL